VISVAKVDLGKFDEALKGMFLTQRVRPGRYVKRAWARAGKPDSLKAFARTLEPWDAVVRLWLHGPPLPDPVTSLLRWIYQPHK